MSGKKQRGIDVLIDEMDGSLWVASLQGGKLQGLEIDPANEEVRWGSLYWARVIRVDATLDAAFVSLDGDNQGFLKSGDLHIVKGDKVLKGGDEPITKLLKAGDFVLVQAKEGKLASREDGYIENKLPRVSMNISLPGRYIIFTPFEKENRISRRIREKGLRKELETMLTGMVGCHSCILRAAAANTQTDILAREHKILSSMWGQLKEHAKGNSPQLIMLGPDAVQRTLGDHAIHRVDTIEVVTLEQLSDTEEWCELFAPDLVTKITPVELDNPYDNLALFEHRDILDEIDGIFQPYAILKGGSTLILQQTAALTAVDVNRAADTESNLNINRKAAEEAARQIRLRNLGGIIMIDFINLKSAAEKKDLLKKLEEVFDEDPCTVQIHGFTKLGLIELSRERRTPPLDERYESAHIDE
ncbi:MAG: ribonuclease E/G [Pseudobdellovibrionaceae bacterium]